MSCLLITLNKCIKGHKSLGLLLGGVLKMYLSLSLSLYLSLSLSLYLSLSIFLVMSSQNVFVIVFVFVFVSFFWSTDDFVQMSQRSQVSGIAL